jgi:hypothetical protein
MKYDPVLFLMNCTEPWVKYNTYINILGGDISDDQAIHLKQEILEHEKIREIIKECMNWPNGPLKRHNDANHLLHKICMLADFGLKGTDYGIKEICNQILENQSSEGSYLTNILIPRVFGGTDEPRMQWMLCDAPTLLYSLLKFEVRNENVERAIRHLELLVDENGWRCRSSIPKMRGPGRKDEHCPYANLVSLKALSMIPELKESEACRAGVESQLWHWENRTGKKIYMFGIGSTFINLKYPLIWYDILHVVDVLSHYEYAVNDPRFQEMQEIIYSKQQEDGSYIPESIFRAWKHWSFGQKKQSSPWLTYKISMIAKRTLLDNKI